MDLTTNYLGMKLRNPLVVSASPLSDDLDEIKKMRDAGASAVVLRSIFEEQLRLERFELHHHLTSNTDSFSEALNFFPEPSEYHLGPDDYLEHIRKAKKAVDIPIIGSINGTSLGGWTDFAKVIEKAGADALELNIYAIPTDPDQTSDEVEQTYLDILKAVKGTVKIPVALKLSPFFSNLSHLARRFDQIGANALVLFNRFYQPDIDLETLELSSHVLFSTPQAMRLPLRWIAILSQRIKADLAATGGIYSAQDVVKMLLVGANVTMFASALMESGLSHLRTVEKDLQDWMEKNEYESVQQMRGSMSQIHCEEPSAFERAQYVRAIKSYVPAKGN
ncbi:MAG: dihydroorotate dehydrogenase-like protein [Candidatus Omnitrophica bacterium]|nr:dihydroorotate dehydrogenase-like protein [Candidatus Omnitrophota bacterium]